MKDEEGFGLILFIIYGLGGFAWLVQEFGLFNWVVEYPMVTVAIFLAIIMGFVLYGIIRMVERFKEKKKC